MNSVRFVQQYTRNTFGVYRNWSTWWIKIQPYARCLTGKRQTTLVRILHLALETIRLNCDDGDGDIWLKWRESCANQTIKYLYFKHTFGVRMGQHYIVESSFMGRISITLLGAIVGPLPQLLADESWIRYKARQVFYPPKQADHDRQSI